jgi:hypothetical protein
MTNTGSRAFLALGAATAVVMLPGLILTAIDHPVFATVAGLGALASLMASLTGGLRLGVIVSVSLALASGLALTWADSPWLAAFLMVVVSVAAGLTARTGISVGVMPAAIVVAFVLAQPPVGTHATASEALEGAMAILIAGVFAAVVGGALLRGRLNLTLSQHSWPETLNYAAVLGVLVGLAAWFVAGRELHQAGAWLLLTILVVVQPSMRDGFRKACERAVGTVVGVVLALVIGLVGLPVTLVYVVAIAFLVLTVIELSRHSAYWEVLAFLTPAIILLVGVRGSIASTAEDRLFATLIGAGAALVVMGVEALVVTAARRGALTSGTRVAAGR